MNRKKHYFFAVVALILSIVDNSLQGDAPTIQIHSGRVKGEEKESRDDKDFFAYRGIPYAKAKRFEPPQKPDNWSDVRDAEEYGKPCIQYSTYERKVTGIEDCHFINVFTPSVDGEISKKLMPVMVFIHGGFMDGTSEIYRAHYFMDAQPESVVIVTFNYRLNVFGFLSTGDDVISGNMGLKDQVMALSWVQQNIRKFGGDSSRVTIFGAGDGASAVHLLMLSPLAKGLFRKAITQSNNALKLSVLQKNPKNAAANLAQAMDCVKVLNAKDNATKLADGECMFKNSSLIAECLKLVDAKKLAEYQKNAFSFTRDPLSFFGPVVEHTTNSHSTLNHFGTQGSAFLTEHPYSIMTKGQQNRVPWMTGINVQEGLIKTGVILANKTLVEQIDADWMQLSPKLLQYDWTRTDITNAIRKFYLSDHNYDFVENSAHAAHADPNVNATSTMSPLPTTIYPILNHLVPTPQPIGGHLNTHHDSDLRPVNFEEQFKSFTDMFTDRFYAASMVQAVEMQAKLSPAYVYYNAYEGQFSLLDVYTGKTKEPAPALKKVTSWFKKNILGRTVQAPKHMGVCNGDELPLLFKYPDLKIKESNRDYQMSKSLIQLWIQFATDETKMSFHNTNWLPANPDANGKFNVMKFGNDGQESGFGPISETFWNRIKFWKTLKYLAPFDQF